jgi:hypothetical protein
MLGYTKLGDPIVIFGSKSGTTYTPATLTDDYTDNTSDTIRVSGVYGISLDIEYTYGSGETSNKLQLQIEGSTDGTNWFQLPNDSTTDGTSTITSRTFEIGQADSNIHLNIRELLTEYIRIKVQENGVASNYGTVSIELTLWGSNE